MTRLPVLLLVLCCVVHSAVAAIKSCEESLCGSDSIVDDRVKIFPGTCSDAPVDCLDGPFPQIYYQDYSDPDEDYCSEACCWTNLFENGDYHRCWQDCADGCIARKSAHHCLPCLQHRSCLQCCCVRCLSL